MLCEQDLCCSSWKSGGYRQLPVPNIACSGIAVTGQLETWTRLAGDDVNLRQTLERHYHLFRNAPDLGSLINPNDVPVRDRMFSADYAHVEPLLARALTKEKSNGDPVSAVFGAAAEGVARAAKLLAGTYTLITTNVPFLSRSKQDKILREFCELHYSESKGDLATAFLERCRVFTAYDGSYAVVTPQNWRFLEKYTKFREKLLTEQTWNLVVGLGSGAFQTPMYEFSIGFTIFSNSKPIVAGMMTGIDISIAKVPSEKAELLREIPLKVLNQADQLQNPDARISLEKPNHGNLLSFYAHCYQGVKTGDDPKLRRFFWELAEFAPSWRYYQSTVEKTASYSGRELLLNWKQNGRDLARHQGISAWGKFGIAVSQMANLPVTLYSGEAFDSNVGIIIPNYPIHLPAIWAFCQSPDYRIAVRQIDQKLGVANATLVKVPFDLEYWQKIADEAGPLPEPYSYEPTQWLFKGNPMDSTEPLQVAVARLLSYHWPQQTYDNLYAYAVKGGIICLHSIAGEERAVERLRALLAAAYGEAWSPAQQDRLLANAGLAGKSLDIWLRDGFFAQHCSLFHNRPFIWHIWDGLKDGFSALVNYHQLDAACLDRLIYTYLGSWITTQRAERDAGVAGAEARLVAAINLQKKLEAIREGEPPFDIYVRWKPLSEQPVGWNPDLNDGVRINIRPFVTAGILRSRFTINWNKDRGTNPDGSVRLNDLHYTLAEKREAKPITIQ
jgi:hypothetical protein